MTRAAMTGAAGQACGSDRADGPRQAVFQP
jgi:hypothetical protein